MMSYQRLNILTGWILFAFATVIYAITMEPTMPFWDCGEFIASAYKLEVGHPPGAPLFMLIARLFSAFVPKDSVALMVNFLSALASGATIMFLHWSITHMAKKIAELSGALTAASTWAVIGSGVLGGLVYTFSDTFWFSAVEGEVYAMSSLFTAVVFWAILKWESVVDTTGSLRWLILIAYLMGLSIGVHLLNLLAIPAICFVFYFKYYKVNIKGIVATGLVSLGLLVLIQTGIIIWFVKLAGLFERTFVNSFGLPFNSGAIFYVILLTAALVAGLWYTHKKQRVMWNTLILGITVALLGYTTFAVIIIRSQANPPMDENNPENLFALLSYLNREQYGDRPLLKGQYFNTPEDEKEPYKDGADVWVKSYSVREDNTRQRLVESFREPFEAEQYINDHPSEKLKLVQEYIESGEKKASIVNYRQDMTTYFPRMYSSQGNHVNDYKLWSNYKGWNEPASRKKIQTLEESIRNLEQENRQLEFYLTRGKDQVPSNELPKLEDRYRSNKRALERKYFEALPSKSEDIAYFTSYQLGWMYWRYFMWNFAGRQNDYQGHGDFIDGNWLTGFKSIDQQRLGNQDQITEIQQENKARNKYYLLPLILGCIGLVYQLVKHPKDFSVVALLFFLTGIAIVIYLNQTPQQPRERDYAYAGSFYAFAIWIGLGLFALYDAAVSLSKKQLGSIAVMSIGGAAAITLVESVLGDSLSFGYSLLYITVIATAMLALMWTIGQFGRNALFSVAFAAVIALPVPALMASEGWDDHSRARRRTGVDMAWNYFASVQPNGIIFTNGDNDTFPLWYAQEVEDTRTDARVVNLSLLNTDWYIDQMKRQAYSSAPVPFKMSESKYRQGTRDVLFIDPYGTADEQPAMSVQEAIAFCTDDKNTIDNGGKRMSYLPTYKLYLKVDPAVAEKFRPYVHEGDSLVTEIRFELTDDRGRPKSYITKAQLMCLDLLANMDWDRPVYFAVTTGGDAYMGLQRYFQLEGLAYRLTPILHKESENPNLDGGVGTDLMYDNMMNQFRWGNMDKESLYLDENNRRMTSNLRLQFSHLADQLVQEGRKQEALNVLNKCLAVMPEHNVPYDQLQIMWQLSELYYDAGDNAAGLALSKRLIELAKQEIAYYQSLEDERRVVIGKDVMMKARIMDRMVAQAEARFPNDPDVKAMSDANNALLTNELMEELGVDPRERDAVRRSLKMDLEESGNLPTDTLAPKGTEQTTRTVIGDTAIYKRAD